MTRSESSREKVLGRALDLAIVGVLFAVSFVVAYRFISGSGIKTFAEWELAPAAMIACGQGFTQPSVDSAALQDFLLRRRTSISCRELTGGAPPTHALLIALDSRYSIAAAGLALRLGGLSWQTVDVHMAALFGLSMCLAYCLYRFVVNRLLAACGVISLVCSNHLGGLVMLRDYVKEPCFFALWLAVAWLLRRAYQNGRRALYAPACVAGVITGIGIGFRVDVLVGVPIIAALIVCGVPGFTRDAFKHKAVAVALFLLSFAVAGAPILSSMSKGSNSSHVTILGLMTPFNRTLGLQPTNYDFGNIYSDGFVYALIGSYADVVQQDPDPTVFLSVNYDRAGARFLADAARSLPADLLVRVIAATAQVIRYPFDRSARQDYQVINVLASSTWLLRIAQWRAWVLSWFDGYALLLAVGVLFLVFVRSWQLGLVSAAVVVYFCGYSMLQFARRHTFHLDLVAIGLVLMAAQALIAAVRSGIGWGRHTPRSFSVDGAAITRRMVTACAALGGLALLIALMLGGARLWQQRHMKDLLERTLASEWVDWPTVPEPLAQTVLVGGTPVTTWQEIFERDRDTWSTAVLLRGSPSILPKAQDDVTRVRTEYLLAELGGENCRVQTVPIALKYTGAETNVNKEFTRVFQAPIEAGKEPTRLILPVFYESGVSWARFDGLAVPADVAHCVIAVRRAVSVRDLPFHLIVAVLPPSWRSSPLYQRMQFPPETTLSGTPVVRKQPTHPVFAWFS